jgi:hypothetical protein
MRFLFATLALAGVLAAVPALAHDSWISRGGLKNPAGEWCCGEGDCAVMDDDAVKTTPQGYRFSGVGRIGSGKGEVAERYNEIIPSSELMPISKDGRYWRCKRPDGSRRCVFGPPNGS